MNLHFFGSGNNKSACFVLNSAQRGPDSVVKYSGKVGCCQWSHHCNHYWGDYCYPSGDHRPPRLITWLLAVPLGTWPGDTKVSGPPSDLKKSSTSWKPSGVLMFHIWCPRPEIVAEFQCQLTFLCALVLWGKSFDQFLCESMEGQMEGIDSFRGPHQLLS